MPDPVPHCVACRFWQPLPDSAKGQCRHNPPTHEGWPTSEAFDWCGHFIRRPSTAATPSAPSATDIPIHLGIDWRYIRDFPDAAALNLPPEFAPWQMTSPLNWNLIGPMPLGYADQLLGSISTFPGYDNTPPDGTQVADADWRCLSLLVNPARASDQATLTEVALAKAAIPVDCFWRLLAPQPDPAPLTL